ncbi:carbohydrate-binding protein [Hymenobacter daeguensis]
MKRLLSFLVLSWLALGASRGQAISPYLAGQNAWLPTALGSQVYNGLLDRLWPVVRQSKVKMIRIGGNGVNSNLVTNAQYIALIDSIRRIGAEPMVQVSEGRGRFTAAQAAQVVQYVNLTMGRNIRYWIIGNEPDLNNSSHPNPVGAAGTAAYIKAFASAMKAVDPTILTVGPENATYTSGYFPSLVGGANDITGTDANGRYYIDVLSFHSYPFSGTQTRASVTGAAQTLTNNVTALLALMANANALHNRTGTNALRWALTEFNIDYANPTANTVEGVGVHSFLNGQYWAEVFGVGMKYEAVSMQPWSVHEGGGNRSTGDLGYLDGSSVATIKPRSAFWHEMLVAENLHGTNLNATDNQSLVKVLSSTDNGTTAVMVLNESDVTDYDFTVQLDGSTVPGAAALKINVPAGINNFYNDRIYAQSTLVLLFNSQGALTRKIVYSLQHAQQTLPPTYLNPGQTFTLANFTSDKSFTCTAPEAVTYAATVLGEFTSISWNFGAGATPATGTGKNPPAVTYATAGNPTVTMTLVNADTTIVVSKSTVQVSACVRTPYSGTAAVIPGVIKATEYDNGGQGVAYNDSDVANRGAAADPTVPRPTEGVDTENGDGGYTNVGYSATGEWLKYTVNVLRTGLYRVTVRVSTGATSTGSLRLSVNDVDRTGVVTVPSTGGFGTYQDLVINNVYLEASPNATLKFDIVSASLNFSKLTFVEQPLTGIVVNRMYNGSSTSDGSTDAVELLVTQDHLDIRGLIVKDFESNLTLDNGGKIQFRDNALWKDLRIGTTIVLRRLASGITGYATDTDASDFTIDLLMENTTYLADLSNTGQNFNLTNTDMVLLKTGAASGIDNPVHALVSNNGSASALYTGLTGPKLVFNAVLNTGAFLYPLNPAQSTADYNGTSVAASTSTARNWGYGFGTPNISYINTLRGLAVTPPSIVVNRIYNGSNDGTGNLDAVELLVVQDHLDMRGMIVKDFETNGTADNGGKYQFANTAFWADVRSGTTVVLRQLAGPAGYAPDYDASDFTLDMLLGSPTYLTNVGGNSIFNITQYDMVMVKAAGSPAAGVTGAIHTFATRLALGGSVAAGTTATYTAAPNYKLAAPNLDNGGSPSKFVYPLNPTQTLADYNGAGKADASGSTALNWGYGFGQPNIDYIQSLRNAVTGPDLVVASGQRLTAGGRYRSITVQAGGTLTLLGTTTVDSAVVAQSGGVLISNCQTLGGAGSFEVQAGAELRICDPAGISVSGAAGAIRVSGTRTFDDDASYTYNGTAAQVTGAGLPAQVRNLTVNNALGLSLSQGVSVAQVARLQSGNLATSGQSFTLLSSADGTALVDNSGGVVTGSGTMQRAVTGGATGPAYRQFSSPVAGADFSSLSTTGFTPTFNTAYNGSATPGAVFPFPTVFGYDESRLATATSNYSAFDKGWFSPASASDVMQPNRGYTVNAPAATVAFTGTFNNAAQNSGALNRGADADAGWQLLGNPYPAPLDWSTVTPAQRPGMDAAMYVYQSTGQYAGTYRSYANGIGTSPLIVAGSGYFARVSTAGTPGAVNLTNANRVTTFGPQPVFGRGTADARPQLHLTLRNASLSDDAFLYLEAGASAGFEPSFDAAKLPNPAGLDLAMLSGNTALAINGLAPLGTAEVMIPLALRVPQAGSFTFEVADVANFGTATVYLRDAATGSQQQLTVGSRYTFTLAAATAGTGRFSVVLRPATVTATKAELNAASVSIYPNPAHGRFTVLLPPLAGQREVRATLFNALGQAVLSRTIALTAAGATAEIPTQALAAGVYTLRVQADNQLLIKRIAIE